MPLFSDVVEGVRDNVKNMWPPWGRTDDERDEPNLFNRLLAGEGVPVDLGVTPGLMALVALGGGFLVVSALLRR